MTFPYMLSHFANLATMILNMWFFSRPLSVYYREQKSFNVVFLSGLKLTNILF